MAVTSERSTAFGRTPNDFRAPARKPLGERLQSAKAATSECEGCYFGTQTQLLWNAKAATSERKPSYFGTQRLLLRNANPATSERKDCYFGIQSDNTSPSRCCVAGMCCHFNAVGAGMSYPCIILLNSSNVTSLTLSFTTCFKACMSFTSMARSTYPSIFSRFFNCSSA